MFWPSVLHTPTPHVFGMSIEDATDFHGVAGMAPWHRSPESPGRWADHQLFAIPGRRSKEDETKGEESRRMDVRCKLFGAF